MFETSPFTQEGKEDEIDQVEGEPAHSREASYDPAMEEMEEEHSPDEIKYLHSSFYNEHCPDRHYGELKEIVDDIDPSIERVESESFWPEDLLRGGVVCLWDIPNADNEKCEEAQYKRMGEIPSPLHRDYLERGCY